MTDKAFLNGINDYRTIGDLRGCVNDTDSMERLLTGELGFSSKQIRVRTDSEVTKSELRKGWKWLMKDAKPGDRRVFHFSGHGSYTADQDAEAGEVDHRDELLCLYGMDWYDASTYLLDDELAKWTREIPKGVFVTFILDCCHSGSGTRMIKRLPSWPFGRMLSRRRPIRLIALRFAGRRRRTMVTNVPALSAGHRESSRMMFRILIRRQCLRDSRLLRLKSKLKLPKVPKLDRWPVQSTRLWDQRLDRKIR